MRSRSCSRRTFLSGMSQKFLQFISQFPSPSWESRSSYLRLNAWASAAACSVCLRRPLRKENIAIAIASVARERERRGREREEPIHVAVGMGGVASGREVEKGRGGGGDSCLTLVAKFLWHWDKKIVQRHEGGEGRIKRLTEKGETDLEHNIRKKIMAQFFHSFGCKIWG